MNITQTLLPNERGHNNTLYPFMSRHDEGFVHILLTLTVEIL